MKNNKMLRVGLLGMFFGIGSFNATLGMELSNEVEFDFWNDSKKTIDFMAVLIWHQKQSPYTQVRESLGEPLKLGYGGITVKPGEYFAFGEHFEKKVDVLSPVKKELGNVQAVCYWEIAIFLPNGKIKHFRVYFSLNDEIKAFDIRYSSKSFFKKGLRLKAYAEIAGVLHALEVEQF